MFAFGCAISDTVLGVEGQPLAIDGVTGDTGKGYSGRRLADDEMLIARIVPDGANVAAASKKPRPGSRASEDLCGPFRSQPSLTRSAAI